MSLSWFDRLVRWIGPFQGMLVHEWICDRLLGYRYEMARSWEYAPGCFDVLDVCRVCGHPIHR